ncbi:hypothetical protein [Companilactobacillus mishanensis]|uniref:hypothetical protein n=1 Tax=Companilactobacillus mishanensis TaxID=2486008 RepID=UPI001CDBCC66|nr:hypothetical protein [Companilactobacillus mishanensis]
MVESNKLSPNKDFSVSLVAPWVKGNMFVDDNFLRIDVQNTVLFGMVPAGRSKDTSPLNTLSNVNTSSEYKLGRMLLGAVIFIAGIGTMTAGAGAIIPAFIFAIIGAAIFLSGILTNFSYEKSGIEKSIPLPFFEANHARELEEQVIAEMAKFQNDRNVATNVAAGAATITNALQGMSQQQQFQNYQQYNNQYQQQNQYQPNNQYQQNPNQYNNQQQYQDPNQQYQQQPNNQYQQNNQYQDPNQQYQQQNNQYQDPNQQYQQQPNNQYQNQAPVQNQQYQAPAQDQTAANVQDQTQAPVQDQNQAPVQNQTTDAAQPAQPTQQPVQDQSTDAPNNNQNN